MKQNAQTTVHTALIESASKQKKVAIGNKADCSSQESRLERQSNLTRKNNFELQ